MSEHEASNNKAKSLLYNLIIIIIFSLIFTGIALTFMGYSLMDRLLLAGNNVPIVKNYLPESELKKEQTHLNQLEYDLEEAHQTIGEKQTEIQYLERTINELLEEIDGLNRNLVDIEHVQQEPFEEEYLEDLQELANIYSSMTASRAANILGNLSHKETALILQMMNSDEQSQIMAKLDPRYAADLTLVMRSMGHPYDLEMEALNERLQALLDSIQEVDEANQTLTIAEITKTFNDMPNEQAARILEDMLVANDEFALATKILANFNDLKRATLLAMMEEENAKRFIMQLSN